MLFFFLPSIDFALLPNKVQAGAGAYASSHWVWPNLYKMSAQAENLDNNDQANSTRLGILPLSSTDPHFPSGIEL